MSFVVPYHDDDNLRTVTPVTTSTILYRIYIWRFNRQNRYMIYSCHLIYIYLLYLNYFDIALISATLCRADISPLIEAISIRYNHIVDTASTIRWWNDTWQIKCSTWKRYRYDIIPCHIGHSMSDRYRPTTWANPRYVTNGNEMTISKSFQQRLCYNDRYKAI